MDFIRDTNKYIYSKMSSWSQLPGWKMEKEMCLFTRGKRVFVFHSYCCILFVQTIQVERAHVWHSDSDSEYGKIKDRKATTLTKMELLSIESKLCFCILSILCTVYNDNEWKKENERWMNSWHKWHFFFFFFLLDSFLKCASHNLFCHICSIHLIYYFFFAGLSRFFLPTFYQYSVVRILVLRIQRREMVNIVEIRL